MKKIINIIVIMALLVGIIIFQSVRLNNRTKEYEIAIQNNKAYESQLNTLNEESKVFQFTIEQLEYISDTSIRKLDSMRKELKIKDRQIKQMSNIKERIYITNTFNVTDTFFKEPDFVFDTCLGDEWYTNCLHLEYPNQISSELDVNTDLNCFIHTKRETVNPPCKTWIGRLFQKKHTVINVDVVENNPYSNVKEVKFIKILDK